MSIKKEKPPNIRDFGKVERMTNKQFTSVINSIIELVKAIIPDTPERERLLKAIQNIIK